MRTKSLLAALTFAATLEAQTLALKGRVVTPTDVIPNAVVTVQNGKIVDIGTEIPKSATIIETAGTIYPGLIDLHNHVAWNAQPAWKPRFPTLNRYDWQADADYLTRVNGPHYAAKKTHPCEMSRYGEIKALVAGTTSIVGALNRTREKDAGNACIEGLVRNLDTNFATGGVSSPVTYGIFPLEMAPKTAQKLQDDLAAKTAKAIFHVSEGIDAASRKEFYFLQRQGFITPGVTLIHGVALTQADFQEMAKQNVGLIWSPRTNIELYGKTADVLAAKKAGVKIALAPDWSISGSDNLLDELRFAAIWNAAAGGSTFKAKELVEMVTTEPAEMAGVSSLLGSIAPGKLADLMVIAGSQGDAYEMLIASSAEDVRLVMIGGRVVMLDGNLSGQLELPPSAEKIEVCGREKWLDLTDSDAGKGASLADTAKVLKTNFSKNGLQLIPLTQCR